MLQKAVIKCSKKQEQFYFKISFQYESSRNSIAVRIFLFQLVLLVSFLQYHILLISRTEFIMRYRFLLFDVDNTLLDFDANEAESFRSMIEQVGETWTQELYETYRQMNINLWKQIERKEISVEEGINRRCMANV